jgi:anti-sigma B factor antagonist
MVDFSVSVSESEHGTTVSVAGDVDLATAPRLREVLLSATGDVSVDLSAVSFMDSSGLNALIAGRKHAAGAGNGFAVLHPPELVERAMQLTGLTEYLLPNGAHPDGAHPDGAHPDGAHPDGAHPDRADRSGRRTEV